MDEEFIGLYSEKEAKIISENTAYDNGLKDGKKQGIEQGQKATQIAVVKNLLKKNMLIIDIAEITNLSIKEIEKIQKEIEI